MKEISPQCDKCRHNFHAQAPCAGYVMGVSGGLCKCEGSWPEETRQVSGFCYILTGTPRAKAESLHLECPGDKYPYPCECKCHSPVLALDSAERRALDSGA